MLTLSPFPLPEFAPAIRGLNVTMATSGSIQLQWELAFDSAEPSNYTISYSFRELSGTSPIESTDTITVPHNDTRDLSNDQIFIYNVPNLLPFTEYNFSVVATYGADISSSAVNTTGQTVEGGENQPSLTNALWNVTCVTVLPNSKQYLC